MKISLPHTIENCIGEKLTFLRSVQEEGGETLYVENYVAPGAGPLMHTHLLQEEALTVVKGKIGYVVKGGEQKFGGPGETIVFKPGVAHRFWNAGDELLHCTGYIKPANTIVYFLSAIYAAQNKNESGKPEIFDAAFLMTRYQSEYTIDIPWFVKKVIVPLTYFAGKMLGKYDHFKDAPPATKTSINKK